MKKMLFSLLTILVFGYTINSQVIFSVESPEQIQGYYDMTYAPSGGDWISMVDLLDPAEAVLDTLAFFSDGSEADSLGCLESANTDVANKIAVLYRGECQFGTKALNAQQAGALAVVIINNASGDPVGLAAGDDGPQVEIPTVMIGDTDGALIVEAMKSGIVETFIGNKTGFYPNDVGSNRKYVQRAHNFGVHSLLAQDETDFSVEMGGFVYNYGFNDITKVNLLATIELDGTIIYDEVGTAADILAGDSLYFTLPTFSQTSYDVGYYNVTYTIVSDSADDYTFDNKISADFAINDELVSFSSLDTTDFSLLSPGLGRANADIFEACVMFRDPNASRVAATGLSFSAYAAANSETLPSIDGVPLSITVSRWDNEFTDLEDPAFATDGIIEIAQTDFFFDGDVQGEIQTAEFYEPIIFDDNQRYLFCITTFESDLFFAYDRTISYELTNSTSPQPMFPLVIDDVDFFPVGFGENTIPAFGINMINASPVTFTLTGTDPSECGFDDGFITISGLDPNTNYELEYDNNPAETITTDGEGNYNITGLNADTYTEFTITDANCQVCSTTDGSTITITDPNPPSLDAGIDQEVCEGESVTLTANNPDGADINWDNGVTDDVAFVAQVGTTTYTVTAELDGCINIDQVNVTTFSIIESLVSPGDLTASCDISEQPAYSSYTEFINAGGSVVIDTESEIDENSFILVSEVSDANICPEVITRTYRVDDNCGNFAEATQQIIVSDEVDPVMTCTVTNDTLFASETSIVPDYTSTVTASDNCTVNPVISQSPESGSTLSLGVNTITMTATDDCGNESTCIIEVLYEDDANIDESQLFSVNFYPNPTSNILNIDFGTEIDDATIIVYDSNGKLVINTHSQSTKSEAINLAPFAKGIYTVIVHTSNGSVTQKISKM